MQEDYREPITRAGAVSLTGDDSLPATDTYFMESSIACVTVIQVDEKDVETRHPVLDNIDMLPYTRSRQDSVDYKGIARNMSIRSKIQLGVVLGAVIVMIVLAYVMYY